MSDLAYRHAWNTGFNQRFAELGMVKEAMAAGAMPFLGGVARAAKAPSYLERATRAVGLGGKGPKLVDGMRSSENFTPARATKPSESFTGRDFSHNRTTRPDATGIASGSPATGAPGGAPASSMYDFPDTATPASATARRGSQIPKATGWGANQRNWMADKLWNDRSTWGRAGIVGGGAQAASLHVKARGAQGMYDRFEEEHPILAGAGRLFGVKRPGYFQSMGNPLNPLGIF